MENKSEVKTTSLADIKCPVCGGPVNRWQFAGNWFGDIVLICECWSGDLHKKSKHHIFKAVIPVAVLDLRPEEEEEAEK